jgi:hypothetical protein
MGIFQCYLARSKSSFRDHRTGADAFRCLKVAAESISGEAARCPVFFEHCRETIARPVSKMISRPRGPSIGRWTLFISGASVDEMIHAEQANEPHPAWDKTLKLIMQMGTAPEMTYLHENRIIHRDLTPADVLLDENLEPKF